MNATQIHLSEWERTTLQTIAEQTGKSETELLHQAVSHFLQLHQPPTNRLALLREARGMWRERNDLPKKETVRVEFDRKRVL